MSILQRQTKSEDKKGFTVIEVMLVLAVSGVLLIGVLTGTYSSIASQRYNDSVRSFSEFLRQIYSEVISPESLGAGNSDDAAIYGKVIFFGVGDEKTIYSATLVGDPVTNMNSKGFIAELGGVKSKLFCGTGDDDTTLEAKEPAWEAEIDSPDGNLFRGTVIIARSPASGTVHTAYSAWTPSSDLSSNCSAASSTLAEAIKNTGSGMSTDRDFATNEVLHFCVKSDNSRSVRNVELAADGRNTSAVRILTEEENAALSEGDRCQ